MFEIPLRAGTDLPDHPRTVGSSFGRLPTGFEVETFGARVDSVGRTLPTVSTS